MPTEEELIEMACGLVNTTTYTEGGRGRKQCAGCLQKGRTTFIGARVGLCPICQSTEFVKRAVVPEGEHIIKTFDEGGQGKKQCAKCKKFIGARHSQCICSSTEFIKAAKPEHKPMTTYEESGKGRKYCSNCGQYIPACALRCLCGNEDFTKKANDVPTYEEEGRGRKRCIKCNSILGSRSHICSVCGYKFPAKSENNSNRGVNSPYYVPLAPYTLELGFPRVSCTGDCPCKLHGTSEEEVKAWAEKCIDYGVKNEIEYTIECLKYWVRYFYEMHCDTKTANALAVKRAPGIEFYNMDYLTVIEHLDNIASELYTSKSEVMQEELNDKFWDVVTECLVVFHERSVPQAMAICTARRESLSLSEPSTIEMIYAEEPFDMACQLENKPLELLSFKKKYQKIKKNHDW